MADDIDPNAIPFVPDTSVSLVDVATGKPKTAFHDWMQSLYDWMKRSVVDLTTKVTTLTTDVGDLSAEITEEATIRETEDGILASDITAVEAIANSATANGQVYLQAMAGPAGSTAAFGIFLTAGNKFTGLMLVADSVGGSEIVMMSGALRFYDSASGSLINMLTYTSGEWVLNGNVTLQAADGSGATFRWAGGHIAIRDGGGNPVVMMGVNI